MNDSPDFPDSLVISWTEAEENRSARWRSEAGNPPPKKVIVADDRIPADVAYKLVCEGTGLLWRGDFQNARQLLQALARRIDKQAERKSVKTADKKDKKDKKAAVTTPAASITQTFHQHRQAQAQRARILGMLLVPLEADYAIPLRRAPDVSQACEEVYGAGKEASVATLREVLGLIGAHEWRKKGVPIPALDGSIHPYYGVFSPVRGEYIDLIGRANLPSVQLAFDIGTGTGVLAALLVKRGVKHIVATDQSARALECAAENLKRLGVDKQVELVTADLFPPGQAPLIVCNPPWVPAKPSSPIEHAIYDPDSRMLRGFLDGLAAHLTPNGEGWLILSDFAEHLGLRSRAELQAMFDKAGLRVALKQDIKPRHPRSSDAEDPLHAARVKEVTSLWVLKAK
ncbi:MULTISPECIES: class I SAM-dependent methyltransferase [unclassified Herbaspirillum]|uniref:methyltransferase n=1 Tax=unclassified Herbaspirillum TaxID=2624150 RepID=UPI000E2F9BC5|nr:MULTISPECIES: class I SAM-dependent methyltransferase [unclassified Herbaspirillum]RFB73256.1 class I SAM-dependent methyltransferase [Herbaspirillum sp. 3R-3a1]TFI10934.1 class I SAM-dependent methyltransferase [Herbaspirillum sp. 3R11]TFI16842.1 class I SAM-dependent methyltransferase [Herbaspirillum sp. 3R-11]TFI20620.1 class I SAM-dependent methyltransferase [Herbaspirillum sp. 3C11]